MGGEDLFEQHVENFQRAWCPDLSGRAKIFSERKIYSALVNLSVAERISSQQDP